MSSHGGKIPIKNTDGYTKTKKDGSKAPKFFKLLARSRIPMIGITSQVADPDEGEPDDIRPEDDDEHAQSDLEHCDSEMISDADDAHSSASSVHGLAADLAADLNLVGPAAADVGEEAPDALQEDPNGGQHRRPGQPAEVL